MILEPMCGVTGSHGNRKRMGLISRWSAPLGRLSVRADIRVLGRKDTIVTGTCRLRLVGIDSLELSSSNPSSDLLAGYMVW